MKRIISWRGTSALLGTGVETIEGGLWKHALHTPVRLWSIPVANKMAIEAYVELQAELMEIYKAAGSDDAFRRTIAEKGADNNVKMLTGIFATCFPEISDAVARAQWEHLLDKVKSTVLGGDERVFAYIPLKNGVEASDGVVAVHKEAEGFLEDFVSGYPEFNSWSLGVRSEGEFYAATISGSESALIYDLQRCAAHLESQCAPLTPTVVALASSQFEGASMHSTLVEIVRSELVGVGFESIAEEFYEQAADSTIFKQILSLSHRYVRFSIAG